MPAEVTLQAYQDQPFKGRVRDIFPSADRAKSIVEVRVSILDPDARVKPEMTASVVFQEPHRAAGAGARCGRLASGQPVVLIPRSARSSSAAGRTVVGVGRDRRDRVAPRGDARHGADRSGRSAERRGAGRRGDSQSTADADRPRPRAGEVTMALIELRDVTKTYKRDAIEIPVLEGVTISVPEGDFLGLMGPSGSGEVDAAQPARRHRSADARLDPDRRHRDQHAVRARARGVARPAHRLHLSALQPDSGAHGVRERRAAAAAHEPVEETAPRARHDGAQHRLARRPRGALSAAALRRAGAARRHRPRRSSPIRRCCSPTSRRATSTRSRRPRCSRCCSGSTPSSRRRSSW